jgi:hypothetical protein
VPADIKDDIVERMHRIERIDSGPPPYSGHDGVGAMSSADFR